MRHANEESGIAPRPAVAEPAPWQFPSAQTWWPAAHTRIHTVHRPGQHVLAVRVALRTPVSAEPQGHEGVSSMVARCLDQGTQQRGAEDLAIEFERRGIAFGTGVGERGLFLDMDLAAPALDDGLDLLGECLVQAAFPADEVRRQVRARLAEISHERADGGSRAALEFLRAHYAPGERAAMPIGGSAATIAALDDELLREFHREILASGTREICVAGDLTGVDIRTALDQAIGTWPAPRQLSRAGADLDSSLHPLVAADAARVVLVDRPAAVQTEIYLGRQGPGRRDPHGWGTFQVISLLLGGSPRSRVDAVLRDERGYTYGVSAGFRSRAVGGLFVIGTAVRTEVTVDALRTVLEIVDIPGSAFSDAEVRRAADFIGRTAPARYGTADMVATELLGLAMEDLGPDFVTQNLSRIAALDAAQVGAAWDDVRGAAWTVVLVGRVAEMEAEIAGLGLGPVSVLRASD